MANGFIGQVNVNNETHLIGSTLFGECSTSATEGTKQVILQNDSLYLGTPTGITIHVKFTNANTVTGDSLKLQIKTGGSGNATTYTTAKVIVNPNGALTWKADSIISFTDDGTYWVINSSAIDGSSIQSLSLGNITNSGTLSNTNATIGNNDQLVIVDNSDSNRIAKASLKFDGSTTTTALTPKGTWETFVKSVTITQGDGITVSNSGTAITGTDTRTISIGTGAITNGMLAGSIENGKLVNSAISIAGTSVSLGGSINAATLRSNLGLSSALRFVGSTTTAMNDGYTGTPAGISIYSGTGAVAPAQGDVVLDASTNSDGAEYVCVSVSGTTYTWELLGRDSSWALDNAVVHTTGTKGDIIYWSDTDTPDHLAANTSTTKKFLSMTSSVPSWTTLAKGDVELDNVTNYAQIEKRIGKTAGDIIYFTGNAAPARLELGTAGQVLTVNSSATAPEWKDNQATDENVIQNILATSVTDLYPLLLSNYQKDTTTTTAAAVNRVQAIYVQPSSGTIYATKFSGNGSGLTNVTASSVAWGNVSGKVFAALYVNTTSDGSNSDVATTNTDTYIHLYDNNAKKSTIQLKGSGNISVTSTASKVITIAAAQFAGATASAAGTAGYLGAPGAGNQEKFLQGSGSWKALSVAVTSNTSGKVLTSATFTKPTFTQGTLASATVSGGILTIVNQTSDTFTQGSLSVGKANLSISAD